MAFEQRDNSHPDFKGTAMVDGIVYWVSGWTKAGQRGEFTSLAFKRKDEQTTRPEPAPQSISQRAMPKRQDPISTGRPLPIDDEIPF